MNLNYRQAYSVYVLSRKDCKLNRSLRCNFLQWYILLDYRFQLLLSNYFKPNEFLRLSLQRFFPETCWLIDVNLNRKTNPNEIFNQFRSVMFCFQIDVIKNCDHDFNSRYDVSNRKLTMCSRYFFGLRKSNFNYILASARVRFEKSTRFFLKTFSPRPFKRQQHQYSMLVINIR